MKKLILIGFGIGVLNMAQATSFTYATYTAEPKSLEGTGALVGTYAYEWGISITPLSAGQKITSATLSFNGVVLTATGNGNDIYASLLNLSDSGVTRYTDNDAPGDFFNSSTFTGQSSSSSYYQTHSHHSLPSGYYTSLGHSQTFSLNASPANWIDTLSGTVTSGELGALNADALDGIFDIGIDPDCHYNIKSITFTYTISTPVSVPDTATTASLLGMSFLGLMVFRRKLAVN